MTARLPDSTEAHFDRCMAIWSDWMHGKDSHRLGVPSRDSVCGNSMTNYSVTEDDSGLVADENEHRFALTVNACVESLMPSERHAVLMRYGFSRVWPFRGLDYFKQLDLGMVSLRVLIRKRC